MNPSTAQLLRHRAELVACVERLAMPSEQQIRYLIELGTSPTVDELGLEFDDEAVMLDQLVAAGLVGTDTVNRVGELTAALDRVPRGSWTVDHLDDPNWQVVRDRARRALEVLEQSAREE